MPCTNALASLVKGRWLDGKAQALILLLSVFDTSAFLFTKLFCRQDVGIVTPPTFPKPHYPTRIPYCNRLYALICFRIGTIPLAFRRGAGLPLPLHQSLLFPLIFAKEHLSLALLAPPVTPSLSIPTTFSKAHQPLRTTSLPPLEKGEVGRL